MIVDDYGYWGKYKIINGVAQKVWIGPMTKDEMIKDHSEYSHNFKRIMKDKEGGV